ERLGTTLTLDKDKNVYTLGLFPASMNIDSIHMTTTNSGLEAYLVKYSTTGNLLWAVPFNLGHDITISINLATDQLGNVIVTGVKDPENFLIKFDHLGNKLWTKYFPMQSYYFSLVTTDLDNNIYLSSEIHLDNATGTTTIGSVTLNQAVTDGSIALIKFTANGDAVWAKTYGGVANADYTDGWPCAIKVDATGNTYIWGWSRNNARFGNITLTNPIMNQNYSYFLSKIDNTGNVVWAKGVYETSQGFNYGDLLDLDNNGNVYVGGDIRSKVSIDGTEFSPISLSDFFIAKFSSTGTFNWFKSIPAYSNTFGALSVYKEDVLSVIGAPYINYTLDNLAVNQAGGNSYVMLTMGNVSTENREIINSGLTIFPNPVVDKLFFNGLTSNATVTITDLSGKVIVNEHVVNSQVNVNNLIKGIYIVQVSDRNGISTRKITKF
ncbi:MAG: T9SS type A sorting domain-containing protein, partial [Paludibacter sp.]